MKLKLYQEDKLILINEDIESICAYLIMIVDRLNDRTNKSRAKALDEVEKEIDNELKFKGRYCDYELLKQKLAELRGNK